METDASVRIGARCPVFQVAFYDTTHIGKLAAYLMVSAGQKLDFQKIISVSRFQKAVIQLGEFRITESRRFFLIALGDDIAFVLLFIANQPIFQMPLLRCGSGTRESPILLVNLAIPEHCRKPFKGLGRLGQYDNSAYRPVESVRYAKEYLAGFRVPLSDESLVRVSYAFIPCPVALSNLSDKLVYDQQVVVLIQDAFLKGFEFRW